MEKEEVLFNSLYEASIIPILNPHIMKHIMKKKIIKQYSS